MNLSTFKKAAIAGALAIGIGLTGVPAAQAQSFGFEVSPPGSGFSFGFGFGDNNGRPGRCIPRNRIDDAIEDQGYRRVRITDYGRRTTEAIGEQRGRRYALIVNSCTGRILDRDRLRR